MTFVKGKSGNPKGRPPKNKDFAGLMARLMEEERSGNKSGTEAICRTFIKKAIAGDLESAKFVVERAYGKVPQAIVGDEDEAPIQIRNIDGLFARLLAPSARDEKG